MRNRSNSGVRLDLYQRLVFKTVLKHQNPVTGLLPATPSHPHAWIRDNVYSILSVWGLALAYKKNADLDEDRAKAYELEQSVVKLMRGLLRCMMMQVNKLEKFKLTQNPRDSLHAKYSVTTGKTVVGDFEYGHLQIDAVSFFLLTLAQMTASGLQIIFTLDEVSFIQNLVFYIQSAYRIPDYGIWERGDKTNHGLPELNASSIGVAKAALEAMNELDLFGARGGPSSVIHVMIDEAQQCQAILSSMLPRESNSKEVDAALLSIISFPAFAVNDPDLIQLTRDTIIEKLQGAYGCCRFIRDGYKTAKEDPKRLHYEPWELQIFENIECEWPLFFAYLVLDGIFYGNKEQVLKYSEALDKVVIKNDEGLTLMPELYTVPADKVDAEYKNPKSQERMPIGKIPHSWGQSLYVLGRLLSEGFLSPGELDPLNRRFITEPKPDLVVQVVILAEDRSIQAKLDYYDLKVQTIAEVAPIQVCPARALSRIYAHLGKNERLGLSGRPDDSVGLLATSKLYTLGDQIFTFLPQFVDLLQFYLPLDSSLIIDMCKTEIQYLRKNWTMMGRPVLVFPIRESLLDFSRTLPPTLVATMRKLQTGYINGTRVQLGNLSDFINTSCVTNLTFLTEGDENLAASNLFYYIESMSGGYCNRPKLLSPMGMKKRNPSGRRMTRKSSVKGIIRRTCSIQIDNPRDLPIFQMSSASSSSTTSPTSPNVSASRFSFPQGAAPGSMLHEVNSHPHLKGDSEEKAVTAYSESQYEGLDIHELVDQLKDAETLHEQADIIHYLFITKGAEWDTEMDNKPGCKVKDLLSELYEKAGHLKQWWLVRHTAGMLRKRVEDLARAATDILVRQKQLAVGLPPEPREKIITRPLPPEELAAIIHDACGEDSSTAMLTQEILVYLAMFIRTEPKLFNEMLRLRVGLIIQVMASELARTLKCTGEEASDQLLNLSPYEMKTLLHHILSGKEFGISSVHSSSPEPRNTLSVMSKTRKKEEFDKFRKEIKTVSAETLQLDSSAQEHLQETLETDRHGQWLRRRRLDGALNRVPVGFYPSMWKVLKRTPGLSIAGVVLNQNLTKEMTPGELKFALQVEMALNRIPEPEYRQLMVEAIEVLTLVVENDFGITKMDQVIQVDSLVRRANDLFLGDQATHDGDATDCCAVPNRPMTAKCGGAVDVCIHFYDSAPSGRFGSMTYMARAVAQTLHFPSENGEIDCVLS